MYIGKFVRYRINILVMMVCWSESLITHREREGELTQIIKLHNVVNVPTHDYRSIDSPSSRLIIFVVPMIASIQVHSHCMSSFESFGLDFGRAFSTGARGSLNGLLSSRAAGKENGMNSTTGCRNVTGAKKICMSLAMRRFGPNHGPSTPRAVLGTLQDIIRSRRPDAAPGGISTFTPLGARNIPPDLLTATSCLSGLSLHTESEWEVS